MSFQLHKLCFLHFVDTKTNYIYNIPNREGEWVTLLDDFYKDYKKQYPHTLVCHYLVKKFIIIFLFFFVIIFFFFHNQDITFFLMVIESAIAIGCYVFRGIMKSYHVTSAKELSINISNDVTRKVTSLLNQYDFYSLEKIDVIIEYFQVQLLAKEEKIEWKELMISIFLSILVTLTLDNDMFGSLENRIFIHLLILFIIFSAVAFVKIIKQLIWKNIFSDDEKMKELVLTLLDIKLSLIQNPNAQENFYKSLKII